MRTGATPTRDRSPRRAGAGRRSRRRPSRTRPGREPGPRRRPSRRAGAGCCPLRRSWSPWRRSPSHSARLLLDDGQPSGATAPLAAPGGRLAPTQIGRVYDSAGPGVVRVQAGSATGTGFVVRNDGTIVTNAHVVGDSQTAQVRFADKGALVDAEVLGSDRSSDLAVLRVDPGSVGRLDAAAAGRLRTRWRSAMPWSRSGIPSASSAPPPPESSPGSSARSRRPTAFRSTRSSRPTPPSTRATRAARCSTPAGAWWA